MPRFLVLVVLLWMIAAAPVGAQTPQWSRSDAEELLSLVQEVRSEGLDPADYDHPDLRAALASGNAELLNGGATAVFLHIAADFSVGHVRGRDKRAWHITGPVMSEEYKQNLLHFALSAHQVKSTLRSLLPPNPEYESLKRALAATPSQDKAVIQRLRANLERWRWMPRELGKRYVLVNVPAFELTLVEDGKVIARRKIIVGKASTPTPQFSATIEAVQFNPSWYVPKSIIAESVGRLVTTQPEVARQRGYVVSKSGIRQRPGPENALGQMKLVMPNPYTIYIHDTPAKKLFDEEFRAYSHGCIRTEDALGFAADLLAGPNWDRAAIDPLVKTGTTATVRLDRPIPVYVTYFTAATDQSGAVASHPDLYGRDGAVVASLIDRERPDPTLSPATPKASEIHKETVR
jgi:L,D-transpeptidase YcbB